MKTTATLPENLIHGLFRRSTSCQTKALILKNCSSSCPCETCFVVLCYFCPRAKPSQENCALPPLPEPILKKHKRQNKESPRTRWFLYPHTVLVYILKEAETRLERSTAGLSRRRLLAIYCTTKDRI